MLTNAGRRVKATRSAAESIDRGISETTLVGWREIRGAGGNLAEAACY
jgi:hypothetical protein